MGLAAAPAPVFDALGDPNRLRIIIRLCDAGPCSTSALTEAIPATRQAATKHLAVLETAGLVRSEKRGRERIWTLQPESLTAAGDYLDALSRRWDQRIDRLRAFVETDPD
ncbi:metalloregulator ArsR/SmtB family transcription factor [[Mycobacterium] wendilense]|uniref:Metalloregulator ArsR/SmtB family transcription factor n=1 Tax=[Mycobacterium] wendilense TaxID=3064284 RepID=A0ABN9P4F0_9MYCO|nr:metalloregulator ArsR/SmtB family transcription factor [Mycolicibacterium sp. MU0050]CAJ1584141.1 metalloregulator ArsR/SmtB family transcription factor [Mycolicibacterium sp. MU0050]